MPLIHLPVQSGSNKILKKMNRKHSIEQYLEIINKLKKINPKIKFSSDFIVGYPGENENDFKKTLKLVKKIKYINSYSFIFSPRPGTPAASFKFVEENIAKKRLVLFQKFAEKIKMKYRKNLYNKKSLVLFENKTGNENEFFGRDEYNNSVIVKSKDNLIGKIKEIKIVGGNQNTLRGDFYHKKDKRDFAA